MLWERSLALLKSDREALLSGLHERFRPGQQPLPLPRHLVAALLDAHATDAQCSEALADASGGWVDVLEITGQQMLQRALLSRWKCAAQLHLIDVARITTNERLFDHLAPEAVIVRGSVPFHVEDVSVLMAPLRHCSSLTISAPIEDELFIDLGKRILSQNSRLRSLSLTGSGVDLMARQTRRNSLINLAAEMRRWSRRLRVLSFSTAHPLTRVIRVLVRQCTLLSSLTVSLPSPQKQALLPLLPFVEEEDPCEAIEAFEASFKLPPPVASVLVEPHPRLKHLFLRGNESVTDQALIDCLRALPALETLDVADCPVNFEAYASALPQSLKLLITDELVQLSSESGGGACFRVQQVPSCKPYISILRTMYGAQSQMSSSSSSQCVCNK